MKSIACLLWTCLALWGALLAQPVEAGVGLFEDRNFRGRHFFVNHDWTADGPLDRWSHRIESIRIPPGWEVWVYKGYHFQGDYRVLTHHWNGLGHDDWKWRDNINSVRIVQRASYWPYGPSPASASGSIAIFENRNYKGEHFFITTDWTASGPLDRWANRIESMRIPPGWEVWIYKGYHFQDDYRILTGQWDGQGEEDWKWRGNIRSVRIVRKPQDPYSLTRGMSPVILYQHAHFQGEQKALTGNWSVGGPEGFYWNDKISSIEIPPGVRVILYEHANFQGRSITLNHNWSVKASDEFWNDRISSIKVIYP